MRALITGGAGFIGSHLTQLLLDRGDHVVVIDDLSTGRHDNVAAFEGNPRFRLLVDTVLNQDLVDQTMRDVDVVFHLASAVGVRLIIDQPVTTIRTIVEGTRVVFDLARRYRKRIVLTSSSEVYGKGSKVPFSDQDDIVLGPTCTRRWLYASAKMLDEFLALAHWHETRLPVVVVRLFNTVGPRQTGQYGMVLPRFVQQALAGEPLSVYGDGEQTRCFCHVRDAAEALDKLVQTPEAQGKVVNIGSSQEVSICGLAQRVIELAQSSSVIERIPYDKAYVEGFEDMRRRVPDLSLAHRLIGYAPTRDLDQIIHSTLDYWRKR
ncbi:MAG: GDP-mannose 4,6-dehydratase [Phycisphaeraceae bacterium]|nr:GDP-mannose 4,6-dehydratase [Phycisphaeraceae bacterium]